jgi:hypothetical protein
MLHFGARCGRLFGEDREPAKMVLTSGAGYCYDGRRPIHGPVRGWPFPTVRHYERGRARNALS